MENPAAMQDEFRRGYRFTPTDDVLLEEYLYPFICGQPYHPYISEANIYADHPSNIFGPSDHLEDDDVSSETIVYHRYFFTRLTKRSQKSGKSREEGAKYIRRVQVQDGGTWHNDKPKPVKDKYGRVIGSRRYLKYAENPKIVKKCGRSDVQWKMYEFALNSKFLPIGHDGDLVV